MADEMLSLSADEIEQQATNGIKDKNYLTGYANHFSPSSSNDGYNTS
jgi:hypothetical protein